MSGILDISISGLNAASARVANAASNIVNASSTPPAGKNATSAGSGPGAGLDANIVELKVDQVNYAANALVIKTAQKLDKALLDIKT